jgi:tRNA(Ile)-lysidine synthase
VAQNLNDNVETIIMRFIRGTGIEGLKGIEAVRDNIIRPLLEVERYKIEDYCKQNNLSPRIDKTNLETIYSRNKIRLELIPYIKQNFNPSIENALTRLSGIVKDENDYLEAQAQSCFSEIVTLDNGKALIQVKDIEVCHIAIKRRLIRLALLKLTGSLKGYDSKNIEGVLELIGNKTGSAIELPRNIKAYISYNQLILMKNIEKVNKKCYYNLIYDSCINLPEYDKSILVQKKEVNEVLLNNRDGYTVYIDNTKIKNHLVLRNREQGDVFSPIGMTGSKKLKDYFIDEKIPKDKRDEMLLIADGAEIIWVIGKRISEKYKITPNTKNILMISIVDNKN